jgi:hypothetical protein
VLAAVLQWLLVATWFEGPHLPLVLAAPPAPALALVPRLPVQIPQEQLPLLAAQSPMRELLIRAGKKPTRELKPQKSASLYSPQVPPKPKSSSQTFIQFKSDTSILNFVPQHCSGIPLTIREVKTSSKDCLGNHCGAADRL